MTNRTSTSFSITRTQPVPTAYDASGAVADSEAEDLDIEGTVSGLYFPAEPDVGLWHDGFEDIAFTTKDELGFTIDYELTEQEEARASERLREELDGNWTED